MSNSAPDPKRGEVWKVDLAPTKGSEIKKPRPAVVLSSDAIRVLPLRLVAPITGWQAGFANKIWHVHLSPTKTNGLKKESSVDVLQTRGLDTIRFVERWGHLPASTMNEIATALAAIIEYE